jgi:hypothetical protein
MLTPNNKNLEKIYSKIKSTVNDANESKNDDEDLDILYGKMLQASNSQSKLSDALSSYGFSRVSEMDSKDFAEKSNNKFVNKHDTPPIRTMKEVNHRSKKLYNKRRQNYVVLNTKSQRKRKHCRNNSSFSEIEESQFYNNADYGEKDFPKFNGKAKKSDKNELLANNAKNSSQDNYFVSTNDNGSDYTDTFIPATRHHNEMSPATCNGLRIDKKIPQS